MHGSFSRADTRNIMGAVGPSFRQGFEDPAPASNADIGKTMAQLMGLRIPAKGKLVGRVLTEAMPNGAMPHVRSAGVLRSEPDADGAGHRVQYQAVGNTRYFDAAGYAGPHARPPGRRTVTARLLRRVPQRRARRDAGTSARRRRPPPAAAADAAAD